MSTKRKKKHRPRCKTYEHEWVAKGRRFGVGITSGVGIGYHEQQYVCAKCGASWEPKNPNL